MRLSDKSIAEHRENRDYYADRVKEDAAELERIKNQHAKDSWFEQKVDAAVELFKGPDQELVRVQQRLQGHLTEALRYNQIVELSEAGKPIPLHLF
ncbi:MAG: hypothetical protein SXG53_04800 [Pseudomonadota bacterium]|nr:hypothetical protein [Pseudomonadota bacterium]